MIVKTYEKPKIQELSALTINRIAAGEVVERPASVVKELVENSIDAGATEINIKIDAGGKNLIFISDNGHGMSEEDLVLCVKRHTTSKLENDDILNIKYFGFRGEALPSIASISRMTIKTRTSDCEEGKMLSITSGDTQDIIPAPHHIGTTIEVRDLFFTTPARLKFLRSEKTEIQHIQDLIKRIALANPEISFSFISNDKIIFKLKGKEKKSSYKSRVEELFKKEFIDNSIEIVKNPTETIKISGYISLPTYDRGTSTEQYLYVNRRPVKDKLLYTAIRVAYKDFISRDRYPVVILFIEIANDLVDVNAHPAKTEVRFRDFSLVRNKLITSLRSALLTQGSAVSSTIAQDAIKAALPQRNFIKNDHTFDRNFFPISDSCAHHKQMEESRLIVDTNIDSQSKHNMNITDIASPVAKSTEYNPTDESIQKYKLGAAKCQLHKTYIISQTEDSIVIVDQHAAHERLLYEKLKKQFSENNIIKQKLLIPEIIEIDSNLIDKIVSIQKDLSKLGLDLRISEKKDALVITEIPQLLGNCDVQRLVQDIIDDIIEFDTTIVFTELMNHILATYACYHSIRSGRIMNNDEMNALLRQMESTPNSGQCNHGRPTYIELKLQDIEKLFGRR